MLHAPPAACCTAVQSQRHHKAWRQRRGTNDPNVTHPSEVTLEQIGDNAPWVSRIPNSKARSYRRHRSGLISKAQSPRPSRTSKKQRARAQSLSRFPRRGFLAIRGTSGSERRPGRSGEDSSSVISTIRSVTTVLSRGKSRRQRATTGSPSCWVFPSETEAASTSLSG